MARALPVHAALPQCGTIVAALTALTGFGICFASLNVGIGGFSRIHLT
ncbi:MAG: hypothetical protein ABIR58_09020 [Gemmatimonadaceae bacterium]